MVTAAWFPIIYTVAALYMDYDAVHVILTFVPLDVFNRSLQKIYCLLLLRTLSLFVACAEFCRSGAYQIVLCVLAVDHFRKLVYGMIKLCYLRFVQIYTCLNIIYCKVRLFITLLLYLLHTATFWGTVMSSWILLKCWGKIEYFIYLAAFLCFVVLTIEQIVLTPNVIATAVRAADVLYIQRKRMKLNYIRRKISRNLRLLKSCEAIQPIVIWYGNFLPLDFEFMLHHFRLVLERIFDAVMIIDI